MIIKIAISAALLLIFSTLFALETPPNLIYNSNWVATDALGRVLPLGEETGTPRADKYVGVFYFLWHGSHDASEIFQ